MEHLVPSTWHQVPGTEYLVPGTWYQVLDAKYFVPGTWYQVLASIWYGSWRQRTQQGDGHRLQSIAIDSNGRQRRIEKDKKGLHENTRWFRWFHNIDGFDGLATLRVLINQSVILPHPHWCQWPYLSTGTPHTSLLIDKYCFFWTWDQHLKILVRVTLV